jgi:N-acetyl-anhydromuramyl-L-alanine amidase AmpD
VTRENDNSTVVESRWAVPDAKTYVEVSGKLLVWAVKSKSSYTRAQFALLASIYKDLVERAASKAREVISSRAVRPARRRSSSKRAAWRQQRQSASAVDSPTR